ncbi:sulfite exporter TauE/SafE family protein [Acidipila sp. EB88]|uniref:sulfite exporter TauE/SafE family protein n=1 Tax=Acidipila sp. EB88 TaxID=2305226 RepID=UPI000F602CF6|nr:sulfite exporter TauE/SafE family protein [Acidipila sp. EB88]RRA48025.1 sulfite exporter TauE/SafE family protein [Acidipila sp. EB88]
MIFTADLLESIPAHLSAHVSLNGRTIWLCCASLIAGLLNAVAGGGSFLSFPALLNMGVPPIQANATNTVALWPGQFTSIAAYWRDLATNRHLLLPLGAAAAVGGVGGGIILLHTGQSTFLHLVPWLLLVAATLFAVSTPISRWLQARSRGKRMPDAPEKAVRPMLLPLVLGTAVVTLYIGYFGAGAGFLMMSLLALFGIENVNQINALKVVTTTIANGVAVLLFIFEGQVLWQHCLLMMVTGAIGGYVGGRTARRLDARIMRTVVTILGFAMAGYFFWRNGGL